MRYKNIFTASEDISTIQKATEISSNILRQLTEAAVLGSSPYDINNLAKELCKKYSVKPSFLGVAGPVQSFPEYSCVMVNSETVHNIPVSKLPFANGDVVKIDFGIIYNNFFTDHGLTVLIGEASEKHKVLAATVKYSVEKAIKEAREGNFTGDISYVMESITKLAGFTPVENYCGHGIGHSIHESPSILFYGRRRTGEKLQLGMLICVENWITTGSGNLKLMNDGWTLKTIDGSISAMHEEMVLISKDGPKILTSI